MSEEQQAALEGLYKDLAKDFPRSHLVHRIPLEFLHGDKFQAAFSAYLRPNLRKGVPSLFMGLKSLYHDQTKKQIIGKVIKDSLESLTKNGVFPFGENGQISTDQDAPQDPEPPSSILWTLYFAAQHHDKLTEYTEALALIDRAISHTPTVIELYTLKAKVLKHAGDPYGAWTSFERARELDLADRYLNTKATLYALRADQVTTAERTIALFTKEGADSQDVLYDMQCMWYETECAASYLRSKDYGRALKKFVAVEKHFDDILEDQFDFHTYCLRKMTLRAYLSLLRLEDRLFSLRFYTIAAKGLVNTYITIHDTPIDTSQQNVSKSAKKGKKSTDNNSNNNNNNNNNAQQSANANTPAKPVDDDPAGEKLATVPDPLEKAYKYLTTLLKYSPNDVEVHLLAAKLNLRRSIP